MATVITRRGKHGGKCAVFVKAEEESQNDGQSASAEQVGREETVFRTENK